MVVIIGAGPAGCYLGYLLAKAGKKVDIFEEHRLVGYPVQCTGIVTSSVLKIIDIPRDVILNQINKIKIIADKEIIFKLKEPNLILNRAKFDQYLAKKAEIAGAKLYLNHSYKNNNKKYVVINDKKIKFDYLIGADGPLSGVLTNNNFEKNKLIYGIQASIKGEFEKNTSLIFLKYGEFAWLVPISKNMAILGLVSKRPKKDFDKSLIETIRWYKENKDVWSEQLWLRKVSISLPDGTVVYH